MIFWAAALAMERPSRRSTRIEDFVETSSMVFEFDLFEFGCSVGYAGTFSFWIYL